VGHQETAADVEKCRSVVGPMEVHG
jgi:hypothetical protein